MTLQTSSKMQHKSEMGCDKNDKKHQNFAFFLKLTQKIIPPPPWAHV